MRKKQLHSKKSLGEKETEFRALRINFKNHGIFPAPSPNHIAILRGSDKTGDGYH